MNIFKNKILFIILLFTLLIITFSSNVFASTTYTFSDGKSYKIPDFTLDDNRHFIILYLYNNPNELYIYTYSNDLMALGSLGTALNPEGINVSLYSNFDDTSVDGHFDYFKYSYPDCEFLDDGTSQGFDLHDNNFGLYTDVDIGSIDPDHPDVFFSPTPVGVKTMEIQQVEEIPQVIIKVVMMILPVCLGIFGILLVIYLIRSKNLLNL